MFRVCFLIAVQLLNDSNSSAEIYEVTLFKSPKWIKEFLKTIEISPKFRPLLEKSVNFFYPGMKDNLKTNLFFNKNNGIRLFSRTSTAQRLLHLQCRFNVTSKEEGCPNERYLLYREWAHPKSFYKMQPLDLIR